MTYQCSVNTWVLLAYDIVWDVSREERLDEVREIFDLLEAVGQDL